MMQSHEQMNDRNITRRRALIAGVVGITALGLRSRFFLGAVQAKEAMPTQVKIVEFAPSGAKGNTVTVATIAKPDADWKHQLSSTAFDVTRKEGTERPYSGEYWNLHAQGLYHCICCDTVLFNANTKFESGTGWPSFWQPIAKENVRESTDSSFGMDRTKVNCRRCDAHLGHVFDDGPQPTGLRYCMNSVSLKFAKLA